MDKRTVYLIWAGGAALALLIYLASPDKVFTALAYLWDSTMWRLRGWLRGPLYDVVRACAIAVFVVFWILGIMAWRRGQPARAALLVFSLIFVLLVGIPSHWSNRVAAGDWVAALLAAVIGATIMTGRVNRGKHQ